MNYSRRQNDPTIRNQQRKTLLESLIQTANVSSALSKFWRCFFNSLRICLRYWKTSCLDPVKQVRDSLAPGSVALVFLSLLELRTVSSSQVPRGPAFSALG